jgi:hypothetical protein
MAFFQLLALFSGQIIIETPKYRELNLFPISKPPQSTDSPQKSSSQQMDQNAKLISYYVHFITRESPGILLRMRTCQERQEPFLRHPQTLQSDSFALLLHRHQHPCHLLRLRCLRRRRHFRLPAPSPWLPCAWESIPQRQHSNFHHSSKRQSKSRPLRTNKICHEKRKSEFFQPRRCDTDLDLLSAPFSSSFQDILRSVNALCESPCP